MDEPTALAIVFSNTKRKRRSVDLITVAECLEFLVHLYGSQNAVAEKIGISSEMIRQFRKILTLPDDVKKMIKARKIDKLDVAYRISLIDDSEKQKTAAQIIGNLQTHDVRDIVRFMKTHPETSITNSKKVILESKPKDIHIFVIDLDEDSYQAIIKEAAQSGIKPADLVKKIVKAWLQQRNKLKLRG
jgi:hypothetical protein